jgi:uncharacterized hydrophobic protein (TIGR00271 family)
MTMFSDGLQKVRKALLFSWQHWQQVDDAGQSDRLAPEEVESIAQQSSLPSLSFYMMLSLSTIIATFGLITNSAPLIIGAMIIAPLMAPIVGIGFSIIRPNWVLLAWSIASVVSGTVVVVLLAYLSASLIGLRITGSEILSRTSPSLIDLGVALASGAAAAYGYARRSIMASMAGVAIAVALVPPLAVTGIGLSMGTKASAEAGLSLTEIGLYSGGYDIALGAFILFLTNLIGIIFVAAIVFLLHKYGGWRKSLPALASILVISLLLAYPLEQSLQKIYVKNRVLRLATKLARTSPDIVSGKSRIKAVSVRYQDDIIHVHIDSFVPRTLMPSLQKRADRFRKLLSDALGEPLVLEVDVIPVHKQTFVSRP